MLLITCFIFGLLGSLTWAGPRGRSPCPSGSFSYKDGSEWNCYKFYDEKFTFEDAEQECQFNGKGHLASFKSDKQAKAIGAYVTRENVGGGFVWIGLQRDADANMYSGWRWVDGSRDTYRKWSGGEPNNWDKKQYCVGLYAPSGYVTWNDLNCDVKLPFLCKWKPS